MARITVEDCIDKFPSRFELVLVASNRARKLYSGDNPTVEKDNDKNTVIALREIAQETLTADKLKNDLIEEYQTNTFTEDEETNEIVDENIDNNDDLVLENNVSDDNKLIEEEVTLQEVENVADETNVSDDNESLEEQVTLEEEEKSKENVADETNEIENSDLNTEQSD